MATPHIATPPKALVLILATLDTKEAEAQYLEKVLTDLGVDTQVVDMTPHIVLQGNVPTVRGAAMRQAGAAIKQTILDTVATHPIAGAVAFGGASGAALAAPTLQALPYGTPKVLVSPVASGDTRKYIDSADVLLIHSVVDFLGRNRYVDAVLEQAARSVLALGATPSRPPEPAKDVGITAFGVTSPFVELLKNHLHKEGRSAVCFSANGSGGRGFENFINDGRFGSVIDATTTELADELFGGALSAGPERLTSAAAHNIPQIVIPGGLDFINFGALDEVPSAFRSRPLIQHTPAVTLVRTSLTENEQLGSHIGQQLRDARVHVVIPMGGFSLVSSPGMPFEDPAANESFVRGVRRYLPNTQITLVDAPINDPRFAQTVIQTWAQIAPPVSKLEKATQ